eukprot:CAMPEP_0172560014 /NCGR_PEP_ID=MMETSP1067-20121228/86755_1 /TAXON_ID=265564 ORGANISM="Thalassiosira punctigera, Strain Tpunct2005C2" /NCGR_SAMPLE_ID=MMETSP1067 /ASSEMBLY_ACC=CAM_ASM_000444 /LENGTH=790 /DNA_ID=CAMNT_0013349737 /DNA_START=268 /DNA_END=2640 /DNA_ORIENTATION=+
MSGVDDTSSGAAAAMANPIKEDHNQQQAPLPVAGDGDNDRTDRESSQFDNLLLSHVVPPSHILADGRFIQLPPPSVSERALFFERAVAVHQLISIDGEDERGGGGSGKASDSNKRRNGDDDQAADEAKDGKRKKKSDAPFVHPLAVASARMRAKGIDELSKAINLGGLVMGGDYFGLTNIVNQRSSAKKDASPDAPAGGEGKAKEGDGKEGDAAGATSAEATTADESILTDQRLRSKYVLRRRQSQYENASTVLSRHEKRLSSSVAVMRILDARLRSLRNRWRLVAPEHGTRTTGPVRPREVVAVDVEVYDRDRLGGGSGSGGDANFQSSLGRIARRVPRYATMELDDDYDVSADILSLRRKVKDVVEGLKETGVAEDGKNGASANSMEVVKPKEEQSNSSVGDAELTTCKTKAEPFAIADPTLGKIDLDFDPDKVPLLTLLFEIEKPSTGFSESATLSSSFLSSASSNDERRLQPDERVIEALQHSLFCASLFESMRAEIIPAASAQSNNLQSHRQQQQHQKSVAWLSSETEESFLPPPSVMAGEDKSPICVIHCHEGEVKVQLDDEYSLMVKLIEAGTAAAAGTDNSSNNTGDSSQQQIKLVESGGAGVRSSGSQSPAQLRTLCRALLLHSQTLYHDHRTETRTGNASAASSEKKDEKPAAGFMRKKKEVQVPSPRILQSCVSYGCKSIFEKKVRVVLKRLSLWLEKDMKCADKISVEWLPLALFDSHSRFVLLFRDQICLDVGIEGDALRVTQTSGQGEFRAVGFGSDVELECFLKMELRRALANEY